MRMKREEVHDFRCRLTTCKCQELHARGYRPVRRMHVLVPGKKYVYIRIRRKQINFSKVPRQRISSSAITDLEGLRGRRIYRGCPLSRRDLSKSMLVVCDKERRGKNSGTWQPRRYVFVSKAERSTGDFGSSSDRVPYRSVAAFGDDALGHTLAGRV